ncbi:MAG: TIGR02221 family CRISPR-associated protein [Campylobacter sp.]|nr:TIGR02221 family CRISPR-associated protein [Campylobacter sp.]
MENFNYFLDIAKNLNKDDEIYLDITHSFRSLSLMSFVMSEAISNLRKKPLNIKSVYYGMFEYSSENDGVTPVVDLKIFFEFLDWSKAIRNFKEYGNSSDLLRLVSDDENLSSFRQNFIYFSNALNMSNMKSIKDALRTKIKPKLSELKEAKNRIYEPIIDELESFVKWLDVESFALFQYNLAKWYAKNKNYALGYMVLQEAIISAVCEDSGFDVEDKDYRKEAQKIILGAGEKDPIRRAYKKINPIRDSITHAFKCDKRQRDSDAINNLDKYLQQLNKPLFKNRK